MITTDLSKPGFLVTIATPFYVLAGLIACFYQYLAIDQVKLNNQVTVMSRVCQVTGKKPMVGNNVSHANNKTRRRFLPNIHSHRFWVESENRWVRLNVSTKGMRTIDKLGIDEILKRLRAQGEKI